MFKLGSGSGNRQQATGKGKHINKPQQAFYNDHDFADNEYTGIGCVETANAANDTLTLAPGESHTLRTILEIEC
jgi:hypothetical protein